MTMAIRKTINPPAEPGLSRSPRGRKPQLVVESPKNPEKPDDQGLTIKVFKIASSPLPKIGPPKKELPVNTLGQELAALRMARDHSGDTTPPESVTCSELDSLYDQIMEVTSFDILKKLAIDFIKSKNEKSGLRVNDLMWLMSTLRIAWEVNFTFDTLREKTQGLNLFLCCVLKNAKSSLPQMCELPSAIHEDHDIERYIYRELLRCEGRLPRYGAALRLAIT